MNIPCPTNKQIHTGSYLKSVLIVLALAAFSGPALAQKAWTQLGAPGVSAGGAAYTAIAVDPNNGIPYVFYADSSDGLRGTVKKFNGIDWVVVGRPHFTTGAVNYCSISINRYGTPFLAYVDVSDGWRAKTMRLADTGWATVGSSGVVSTGAAAYTSIVTDTFGNPYVAFEDFDHSYTATVAYFSGSSWTGYHYLSTGMAEYTSLAVDKWGRPYLVCQDGGIGYKTSLRIMDNGGFWPHFGTPGISGGWASYTSIAIDTNFAPYIAYQDAGAGNKITVMKINMADTTWQTVGSRGFSNRTVQFTSIAINKATNKPFVSFNDWDFGNHATVMTFNTGSWSLVGSQGFSGGPADYVSMALDTSGTPYVAYMDRLGGNKTNVMKFGTAPISGLDSFCKSGTDTLTDPTPGGTWSSSDTAIAKVGMYNGVVSGVTTGTATISYLVPGFTWFSHLAVFTVSVNPCPEAVADIAGSQLTTLTVFPDPSHGAFTLNISSAVSQNVTIIITNMLGEKVKELKTTTNNNTDIRLNTAPGIYFISAITATEKLSRKVIVQ